MAALTGKVALVTGSSRGIGAAIAALFAREGARVVIHGRDPAAVSKVASAIDRNEGCVTQVTGDVTKPTDLDAMRIDVERAFGPVDVLVASAGGSPTRRQRASSRPMRRPGSPVRSSTSPVGR